MRSVHRTSTTRISIPRPSLAQSTLSLYNDQLQTEPLSSHAPHFTLDSANGRSCAQGRRRCVYGLQIRGSGVLNELQVKVSVNGHTIPFDMKIGEAGEAFFVFETDDDVPADLITSPILQPTRPDEGKDVPTDRFGARQDPEKPDDEVATTSAPTETPVDEPEYLDLNAGSTPPSTSAIRPSNPKRPSTLSISSTGRDSPPPRSATPASLLSMQETQDERVDRALKIVQESMAVNEVQYKPGELPILF